jgi:hypothetical protein
MTTGEECEMTRRQAGEGKRRVKEQKKGQKKKLDIKRSTKIVSEQLKRQ